MAESGSNSSNERELSSLAVVIPVHITAHARVEPTSRT